MRMEILMQEPEPESTDEPEGYRALLLSSTESRSHQTRTAPPRTHQML